MSLMICVCFIQATTILKADIKSLKSEGLRVSISGDIWGENGISLFAVLLHWITPDWVVETKLAICEPYGAISHTGDAIYKTTRDKLAELGVGEIIAATEEDPETDTIAESVFAKVGGHTCLYLTSGQMYVDYFYVCMLTSMFLAISQKCDNGSNIKKAWGDLEGHECACHNLQLCVNAFLATDRVKECVVAMNGITAHFSRSNLGLSKLHEIQMKQGLPKSKPSSKSATRWMGQFHQAVWFVHNATAITSYDTQVTLHMHDFLQLVVCFIPMTDVVNISSD